MSQSLNLEVLPLAMEQTDEDWLPGLRPYPYQTLVYRRVAEALACRETVCLFIGTPTGSGKTLAAYAYSILHQEPALGVYPTNELIRDQERVLRKWLDPNGNYRLLRIDSAQLDDWQVKLDLQRHSETLERLLHWEPTILTNPDILFYVFFGLYGGLPGISQRLFTLVGRYRIFVFDEFHLYNVKQMADVALLVGMLHAIRPDYGRVFLFASATPDSPLLPLLRDQLGLKTEVVKPEFSTSPAAHLVAHPLRLTILPADLRRWRAEDTVLEYLPELERFFADYPPARGVAILDSVAAAIALAECLRKIWPDKIGEVHGLSSEGERARALRQPFTIGTSTIEVGIDFRDEMGKDLLLFEARTAHQFIQRLGRIARHPKNLPVPNWAIALVPDYIYHYFAHSLQEGARISRVDLYKEVEEAYQKPEDFARYLGVHAAAEFQEAVARALTLFQPDDQPTIRERLAEIVQALTGKTQGQAWALRTRYKDEERILQPLLTFRGAQFEVAILDERGTDPGFPVKRYDLMFLLRRGDFQEMDPDEFFNVLNRLESQWPGEVARERRYCKLIGREPEDLLGVYGYFRLTGLLDSPRPVWFELSEDEVYQRQAQVTVVQGLEVQSTDSPLPLRGLNRLLRRKRVVAWFVARHPAAIKLGRALPPLFEVYELKVRRPSGALSEGWSIAFNQNAFFLDSLGWSQERRQGNALIL